MSRYTKCLLLLFALILGTFVLVLSSFGQWTEANGNLYLNNSTGLKLVAGSGGDVTLAGLARRDFSFTMWDGSSWWTANYKRSGLLGEAGTEWIQNAASGALISKQLVTDGELYWAGMVYGSPVVLCRTGTISALYGQPNNWFADLYAVTPTGKIQFQFPKGQFTGGTSGMHFQVSEYNGSVLIANTWDAQGSINVGLFSTSFTLQNFYDVAAGVEGEFPNFSQAATGRGGFYWGTVVGGNMTQTTSPAGFYEWSPDIGVIDYHQFPELIPELSCAYVVDAGGKPVVVSGTNTYIRTAVGDWDLIATGHAGQPAYFGNTLYFQDGFTITIPELSTGWLVALGMLFVLMMQFTKYTSR